TISINGVNQTINSNSSTVTMNTISSTNYLFCRQVAVGFMVGYIAEVIYYNVNLTATQISNVNNYLSNKWGIGFTPATLKGLVLWLDGSDPAATGTPPANNTAISSWVDKSSNANNATQGTGANQPVFNT